MLGRMRAAIADRIVGFRGGHQVAVGRFWVVRTVPTGSARNTNIDPIPACNEAVFEGHFQVARSRIAIGECIPQKAKL